MAIPSLLSLVLVAQNSFPVSQELNLFPSEFNSSASILPFKSSLKSELKISSLNAQENENQPLLETTPKTVQHINFSGNTAFSNEELMQAVSSFIGQELTPEQLLAIRSAITNLYVSKGYTTSAAFIYPQDLSQGIIQVQIIEGKLEAVEIEGLKRIRESYVRDRLLLAAHPPLNVQNIQEALQLLQNNPCFEQVTAELQEGTSPGLSRLSVNLSEAPALTIALQADNYESPAIGEYKGTASIEHQNVLGFCDRFYASYGLTEGLDKYDISYSLPINPRNGTLSIEYQNDDSEVIQEPFDEIGIGAEAQTLSFGFRQPIIQTPTQEFALSLRLDLEKSETFILEDIPFSFTEGPENGKSKVTALRFVQEWIDRSPQRVLAARSQFTFGLPIFEATNNDSSIDGQFFSWIGQFQWVQKLGEAALLVARVDTQLTPNTLLPIEQFTIGGVYTIRGYSRNFRAGDNGINSSLEVRFTLLNNEKFGTLELVPFFDVGVVWNNRGEVFSPNTLASTGLGLRWQLRDFLVTRLDYGVPLVAVANDDALQELSFSVRVQTRF